MTQASLSAVSQLVRTPGRASPDAFVPQRQPFMRSAGTSNQVLQAKLGIGAVDDPLEREADRVADAVIGGASLPPIGHAPSVPQRKCSACAANEDRMIRRECEQCEQEENETVRRRAADGAVPGAPPGGAATAAAAVASGGASLSADVRAYFEPRFGRDLSDVRVHTGGAAARAAQAIHARAYTLGQSVAFAPGEHAPETVAGRRLIAHELAHVVQQQGGMAPLVQREPEDDLPELPRPGRQPPNLAPNLVSDPAVREPNCPPRPTRLGNLTPAPPCNEEGEHIDGNLFLFCTDSDIFTDPADVQRLRTFVQTQPSGTQFRVRAYASTEGPGNAAQSATYNRNLSCHRLNRMIRELINAGVQEREIDGAALGPTERFGPGTRARALNRAAVVEAVPPQQRTRVGPEGMSMAQIRDEARSRLIAGDYPRAVDAYFARWTCGRYRTLSDAVDRTNVLIEGLETTSGASDELGTTTATGANTIVLSPRIADATDPIACAENRIVDLTFHHFSRPVLALFADQHRGGMHLVHLAGLPECRINLDPFGSAQDVRAQPRAADPFAGQRPACADRPLQGPMPTQRGPARPDTPPSFIVTSLTLANTSGAVVGTPATNPFTVGVDPANPFEVNATVDASGDPAAISRYQIGFLQTVVAENWENTYADGRRERRRLPLPLRDGAPQRAASFSDPPWFDVNTRRQATPGANQVALTDAPNFRAFVALPDVPISRFFERGRLPSPSGGPGPQAERSTFEPVVATTVGANNRPDRGHRFVGLNTWVVARQINAPPTLGATEFLQGLRLVHRINVDWASTPGGAVTGTGSYSLVSRPATTAESQTMLLRGAVPLDFVGLGGVPLFAEFLQVDGPVARAQAGGLNLSGYAAAVRQIVQGHTRPASLQGEFLVDITIEAATGRVRLDTPDLSNRTVRLRLPAGGDITSPEALQFARTIFPEIRKLVAAPGLTPNEPTTGTMRVPIRIRALQTSP